MMGKAPSGSLPDSVYASVSHFSAQLLSMNCSRTSMAHAGVVDLNANFVGLRRSDLYVFYREVFAGFPGYCSL